MFSRRDLIFSLITGLTTGLIAWRILKFLQITSWRGVDFAWLIIGVPIFWISGVNLGYFLSRWFSFFNQFGKYAAIGFTNAAIDFGILNLFISQTGIVDGWWFSIFKTISTAVAVVHSYFMNKFWAFEAGENQGGHQEFFKFIGVYLIAIGVNVAVASLIVNWITPLFGVTPEIWANVATIIGSALALVFSFVGFSKIVFRPR